MNMAARTHFCWGQNLFWKTWMSLVAWISTRLQDGHAWSQMVFCTIWVSTRAVLSSRYISVVSNQSTVEPWMHCFFYTTAASWIIASFWAILCETKKIGCASWKIPVQQQKHLARVSYQPVWSPKHTSTMFTIKLIFFLPHYDVDYELPSALTRYWLAAIDWLIIYFLQQAAQLFIQMKWTLCECKIS